MDGDKGTHKRAGCMLLEVSALVLWAMILGLIVWVSSERVKVRDPRTACERSTPPWAIAERCR